MLRIVLYILRPQQCLPFTIIQKVRPSARMPRAVPRRSLCELVRPIIEARQLTCARSIGTRIRTNVNARSDASSAPRSLTSVSENMATILEQGWQRPTKELRVCRDGSLEAPDLTAERVPGLRERQLYHFRRLSLTRTSKSSSCAG
jgi:hypothetical protein